MAEFTTAVQRSRPRRWSGPWYRITVVVRVVLYLTVAACIHWQWYERREIGFHRTDLVVSLHAPSWVPTGAPTRVVANTSAIGRSAVESHIEWRGLGADGAEVAHGHAEHVSSTAIELPASAHAIEVVARGAHSERRARLDLVSSALPRSDPPRWLWASSGDVDMSMKLSHASWFAFYLLRSTVGLGLLVILTWTLAELLAWILRFPCRRARAWQYLLAGLVAAGLTIGNVWRLSVEQLEQIHSPAPRAEWKEWLDLRFLLHGVVDPPWLQKGP